MVGRSPHQPNQVAAGASRDDVLAVIETTMTTVARRANLPRSHQRLMERAGVEIDRASYAVLSAIAEGVPARLTELAASMGVDISTACRQVNGLEAQGLVRKVDDPDDKRSALLALNAKGTKLLDRVRGARRQAWGRVLEEWPEDDLAELARLLGRLESDL